MLKLTSSPMPLYRTATMAFGLKLSVTDPGFDLREAGWGACVTCFGGGWREDKVEPGLPSLLCVELIH